MRKRNFMAGLGLVAALAAGGTAFTASNSLGAPSVTKGYGSQSITGVNAESVAYNTNVAKSSITSVGLVLTGNTTTKTIQIAFNDAAPATCSDEGTYDAVDDDTTYDCTVTEAVADATKFALIAE